MPILHINLEGDGILKNFPIDKILEVKTPITVSSLRGGMKGGNHSVQIIIDLPDGRKVLAETSMKLFLQAADMMRAKYHIPDGAHTATAADL